MSPQQIVESFYSQWRNGNTKKKVEVSLVAISLMPQLFGGKMCLTTCPDFIIQGNYFDKADFVKYIVLVYKKLQEVGNVSDKSTIIQLITNSIEPPKPVVKPESKFPLFPVAITDDFDDGEFNFCSPVKFTEDVIDVQSKSYMFDVCGQLIQGIVCEDNQLDYIRARLEPNHKDMRQMKVYLMDRSEKVKSFFYISYYVCTDNSNELIFLLAYKR